MYISDADEVLYALSPIGVYPCRLFWSNRRRLLWRTRLPRRGGGGGCWKSDGGQYEWRWPSVNAAAEGNGSTGAGRLRSILRQTEHLEEEIRNRIKLLLSVH